MDNAKMDAKPGDKVKVGDKSFTKVDKTKVAYSKPMPAKPTSR